MLLSIGLHLELALLFDPLWHALPRCCMPYIRAHCGERVRAPNENLYECRRPPQYARTKVVYLF